MNQRRRSRGVGTEPIKRTLWLSTYARRFLRCSKDVTTIDGLGPYLSLKLIAECGANLTSWPSAKHFTSCLGLAPSNKIFGGEMSRHERADPAAGLRLFCASAVTV